MAAQVGISLSEYNELTPHELNLIVDVYGDKMKMEYEQDVTVAFIGEYFHRVEKLERKILDGMLGKTEESPKQMSDMEMLIHVHQLNAALGGKSE
jgi:hypothetical protein